MTKYGSFGLYNDQSFPNSLMSSWRSYLAKLANYSLSQKTWSAYKTAGKMLANCQIETKRSMHLPLDDEKVLIFVAWLLSRNLQSRTISTYLSGLRQVHLAHGIAIPVLRSDLVKQILTGACHLDSIRARLQEKPVRLPVTPTLMKLLKLEIKESDHCVEKKRLLWAISTLLFNGAFRIHELLSRSVRQFDPNFTLLYSDVKVKPIVIRREKITTIQVRLKSPKTDRIGADSIVDVYESGGPLCPIRAFLKWRNTASHMRENAPIFIDEHGFPLTGKKFNNYLKNLLSKYIDYSKGKISSHSFRAGIASLLGTLGYSGDDIQAVGRWNSRAYLTYLKLPRTNRLAMAREIGNLSMK